MPALPGKRPRVIYEKAPSTLIRSSPRLRVERVGVVADARAGVGGALLSGEGLDARRRLLLPRALARVAVGQGLRKHGAARLRVRAHGRVRVGQHGAGGGEVRLRVARQGGRTRRASSSESHTLHADADAARLDV